MPMCVDLPARPRSEASWHASALRGYAYFDAMGMGELIKSVEKVDELTVRFVSTVPKRRSCAIWRCPSRHLFRQYGDRCAAGSRAS